MAGDFDGDEQDDVVVGVPRGNELFGMVGASKILVPLELGQNRDQ